jgi:NADH-ubiquinone oxidoreductase chain 4
MLLTLLLCIPIIGIFAISAGISYGAWNSNTMQIKVIGLSTSIINLLISLLDGLSIYFVLLTTIITPIALLSN